jgi:hypothetical protein
VEQVSDVCVTEKVIVSIGNIPSRDVPSHVVGVDDKPRDREREREREIERRRRMEGLVGTHISLGSGDYSRP